MSGNFSIKETSDFTYAVGLERASWEDSWSLCQSYAEGFYLADMNGYEETRLLTSWLGSLSIDEPYGTFPSSIICKYIEMYTLQGG